MPGPQGRGLPPGSRPLATQRWVPRSPLPPSQGFPGRPHGRLHWGRTELIRTAGPWHLLQSWSAGQALASRSLFLSSFPWSLSTGQPLRVRASAGQAWLGWVCGWLRPMSLPGVGYASLAQPWAARDLRIPVLGQPLSAFLSLHRHLEPGGTATLRQPIHHLHPQHGDMKKHALLSGDIFSWDHQAPQSGDSSAFNTRDPRFPSVGLRADVGTQDRLHP